MLEPTFRTPLAEQYRAPGGAWDQPSLDELLTRAASPGLARRVERVAGGLRARGVRAGDAVAWQSANRDEVAVLYRACWLLDEGRPDPAATALSKLAVSEATLANSLDAIQIFGGAGYLVDNGIEAQLRDSVPSVIFSGTNDIQREIIVSRAET